MLGRTDRRLRMVAMLLVFSVFGSAATIRLGYWQVVAAPELAVQAQRAMPKPKVIELARAEIIDRDGVTLAQSASLDMLQAHPNLIPSSRWDEVVDTLSDIMGIRSAAKRKAYFEKISSGKQWEWLERQITPEQSISVRLAADQGLLPGISLAPHQVRVYPRKGGGGDATLANQLLGFVDADGRGMYGIERVYDDVLSGKTARQADVASIASLGGEPAPAELPPLRLTIDAKLQRQLERELFSARIVNKAKSVSAVVLDPYTGAILASASVPGYNANDYRDVASSSMSRLRDRVVSDVYEPGSVMKIFTATAALDQGVVTPQTRIRDEKKLDFYKYTIYNADKLSKGTLTVKDAIALSRNLVTAKIAQRLAPKNTQKAAKRLYDLWERVGVAGKTGVDIANEADGISYDPDEYLWAPVDLANRAFGQGVAVTLLQLATGVSTVVNGGYRVYPHVVADSEVTKRERKRVISAKVARQALDILVHTTGSVPWYAKGSLIPGYMIGGKTGTAQIWDSSKGDWKDNIFNHSFIGFVGGDRPEAVIAVRIEEPKAKIDGQGIVDLKIESYELFRMIARGAIKHLDIKKAKDKDAGLPIIGTAAAKQLTPQRNTVGKQAARRRAADRRRAGTDQPRAGAKRTKDKAAARGTRDGRRARSASTRDTSRSASAPSSAATSP